MFHQMHCLLMIREVILQGGARHHIRHCLNILRQAILCASDTTIAPFKPHHETGVGTVHICRDWEKVYDFIEENQLKWIQLTATNNTGVST
jgi:Mycotoxin biosynthesis protein UstYa